MVTTVREVDDPGEGGKEEEEEERPARHQRRPVRVQPSFC